MIVLSHVVSVSEAVDLANRLRSCLAAPFVVRGDELLRVGQHRPRVRLRRGPAGHGRGPHPRRGHGHVPGQGRRPRRGRRVRRVDADARRRARGAGARPPPRHRASPDPRRLPAHRAPAGGQRRRHGGARPLGAPRARGDPAGQVHPAGRGERPDLLPSAPGSWKRPRASSRPGGVSRRTWRRSTCRSISPECSCTTRTSCSGSPTSSRSTASTARLSAWSSRSPWSWTTPPLRPATLEEHAPARRAPRHRRLRVRVLVARLPAPVPRDDAQDRQVVRAARWAERTAPTRRSSGRSWRWPRRSTSRRSPRASSSASRPCGCGSSAATPCRAYLYSRPVGADRLPEVVASLGVAATAARHELSEPPAAASPGRTT